MTRDVRTLLHDTADAPSRGPDIEGAMRSAVRDRRRRRRGVGALVAVVVLTLVGGVFLATGGGGGYDARVATGQSSVIPDGWKTITADPGLSISMPTDWVKIESGVSTFRPNPVRFQSLGGGSAPDILDPRGCEGEVPLSPGVAVVVQEVPEELAVERGGLPTDTHPPLVDRPLDFTSSNPLLLGYCDTPNVAALSEWLIRDPSGRYFGVSLYTRSRDGGDDLELVVLGEKVLNTLRVEPIENATTTLPTTTFVPVVPPPPTSSIPPTSFTATTDDEREIAQVFIV